MPYTISNNLPRAIEQIRNDIKTSNNIRKTILLSPAAASYDQFQNFEERGSYFKKLIKKNFKEN